MKTIANSLRIVVASALVAGPESALAQESAALSEQEVRAFFQEAQEELPEMVEQRDFEGLVRWTDEATADEATFFGAVETYRGDDRKSFTTFMLDKQDVMRMGRMAVGVLGSMSGEGGIEDYSISFDVQSVTPVGADAATVSFSASESATLAAPQGAGEAGAAEAGAPDAAPSGAAGGEASLTIEATADCHSLIRRSEDGARLVLGLTACNAEARL